MLWLVSVGDPGVRHVTRAQLIVIISCLFTCLVTWPSPAVGVMWIQKLIPPPPLS